MAAVGALRASRGRIGAVNLTAWIMLAFTASLVLYPLAVLVFQSFQVAQADGTTVVSITPWRSAFSDPAVWGALWNTFLITAARQAIAFPVGVMIAWTLARTDIPGAVWIEFMFWLAFFLPVLPSALGWIMLLDPDVGLLNQLAVKLLGMPHGPFNIFSFGGLLWTHLMTGTIAIKVMLLTPVFRNMDATMEEASQVSGASGRRTFVRVFLPLMTPALLIAFLLATVYSMQTFELEAILGPPFQFYVFSTQIYFQIYHDPPQVGQATALGSIVLGLMLPLIAIERWSTSRSRYTVVGSAFKPHKVQLRRMRMPVFVLVIATALTMTAIPLIFLLLSSFMKFFGFFDVAGAWTTSHWTQVFRDSAIISSVVTTLVLAASSAVASVVLTTLVAYLVVRARTAARAGLDFLSWVPATIPGILLSLGLMWALLENPLLRPIYGSVVPMILATVIGSMPLCVQLTKANLLQLGTEFEESGRVSGGAWGYTFLHILLPMLTPTVLLVGVVTFVSAARNVASVALLASSTTRPLSLLQLDFMSDGQYERAAVVGTLLVFLTSGVALLARLFGLRVGIARGG